MVRTILLTLHIAAVGGWLGANYVQLIVAPRFARAGREPSLVWANVSNWLGTRYYGPVGFLIATTGALLVLETGWDFGDGFVWVGIAVVAIGAGAGVAVFEPHGKRRVEALERGDEETASSVLRRILTFAALDTALVLLAVLAMVDKWMSS